MSVKDEPQIRKLEISKTITIEASPEVVFGALTRPEELARWFQDEVTLETRVGGKVRFVTLRDKHPEYKLDRDCINEGIIKEFVPNKKLAYTWKFDDLPEFPETLAVWELEQIEPNKTKVELNHTGFTGKEKGMTSLENHDLGWTEAIDKLAKYCTGNK
jgi:uncharacterized protein YndB with AHSA1/START domain